MASEKMINEVLPAYRALTESDKRFVEGLMQGIMLARGISGGPPVSGR